MEPFQMAYPRVVLSMLKIHFYTEFTKKNSTLVRLSYRYHYPPKTLPLNLLYFTTYKSELKNRIPAAGKKSSYQISTTNKYLNRAHKVQSKKAKDMDASKLFPPKW